MSRAQLVKLVAEIKAAEVSEAEHDRLIDQLEVSVLHPRVIDLIYYAEPELTAEEVVDEALRYKPIAL